MTLFGTVLVWLAFGSCLFIIFALGVVAGIDTVKAVSRRHDIERRLRWHE
jgi:hypothetical protein